MTHTTNYNLNKFEATDRVTRDGFNDNADAIDAALKANADAASAAQSTANAASDAAATAQSTAEAAASAAAAAGGAWVKLLEYTLSADAADMAVDVSGIDFTQYVELRLIPEVRGSKSTTTVLYLTYNDCTRYYTSNSTATTSAGQIGSLAGSNSYSSNVKIFFIADVGIATLSHAFSTRGDWSEPKISCAVKPSELTSLHIAESGGTIRAGSLIRLYGLKK